MSVKVTNTDLALAEQLIARGNDVKAVAAILGVTQASLAPIAAKAEAHNELREGYERGDSTQTFGDWCGDWAAQNGNILGLNEEKPYLTVSGMARREGWTKGTFKTIVISLGRGRARVENSAAKIEAAAKVAVAMAQADNKLNLKLAQIKAASQVDVTDLISLTKELQKQAPDLWKPRNA